MRSTLDSLPSSLKWPPFSVRSTDPCHHHDIQMDYGVYKESYCEVTSAQVTALSSSCPTREKITTAQTTSPIPIDPQKHGSDVDLVKHILTHNRPGSLRSQETSAPQIQSIMEQDTLSIPILPFSTLVRDNQARLDMQHFALGIYMDSYYPFKNYVDQLLEVGQSRTPEILDVGTGSGRWAVDMAIDFPEARVTGIDIIPPNDSSQPSKSNLPMNCHFETDDFHLKMEHYTSTFILVHARRIHSGLQDTEGFMYEMARVLKPGGMFILTSCDPQGLNEEFKKYRWSPPTELDPQFSWVHYLTGIGYISLLKTGHRGSCGMVFWEDWLRANPNFCEVLCQEVDIPLGAWPKGLDERHEFAANLMREDLARAFMASKTLYVSGGFSEADVVRWIEAAVEELKQMNRRTYRRVRFFGAIRSNAPFRERTTPYEPPWFGGRSMIYGIDPWKVIGKERSPPFFMSQNATTLCNGL